MLIATLEDVRFTNNNIYLTYIDFKYNFGSIYHVQLLVLMEDLRYLQDAIESIDHTYTNSTISFLFGTIPPNQNKRRTIQ